MLNARDSSGGGYCKVAISEDGGHSYSAVTQDKNLPDPTNNAHIAQMLPDAEANSAQAKKLLYTVANSQTSRSNVSAQVSCDDGKTWPGLRTICRGTSAYSVAEAIDNGKYAVFYEANYTDAMQFATFDESWLNYVCAPMTADSFSTNLGTTLELPVTITNREPQAISGSITATDTDVFSTEPQQVSNLAAGASTTVTLLVKVAAAGNGNQILQVQFTSTSGKTSQATVSGKITAPETTGIEVQGQRADSTRDLATNPYVVGEKLPYTLNVTNIGNIAQWVVPTGGNFSPFAANPVGQTRPSGNCRYSNLAAAAAYACTTARHEVTSDELSDGYFVPETHWSSGRIGNNAVVDQYTITGEEVDLIQRQPSFSVAVSEPTPSNATNNSSDKAGTWISYDVTVTNTGNVRLRDDSGPGFSFASIDAGETKTSTVRRLQNGNCTKRRNQGKVTDLFDR